ncbi:MAG TPA: creatininase family protein, partial [bacterium]|nr:creatininase family protein [bacterium]
ARAAGDPVVVLPTGSIEQHGPHLPVKTDTLLVSAITEEAVRRASARVDVLLAPTVWMGLSTHHTGYFSLTLSFDIYQQVITEILESLIRSGFRRMLIINGHGGNTDPLHLIVTRVRDRHKVLVATADYWDLARDEFNRIRESRVGGMGHACEWETSGVMHLEAGLVRADRIQAEYPPAIPGWFVIDMTQGSAPVKIGTRFEDITRRGVVGDPTLATPEKGRRFFEAAAVRLEELLIAFAGWSIEDGVSAGTSETAGLR